MMCLPDCFATASGSHLEDPFETADQDISAEGLSEQTDCATGYHPAFQIRIRTPGDHDHRKPKVTGHEKPLEINSAHTGHVNVGDDTVTRAFPARREKIFRGCKPTRAVSQRIERLDKRCSERFVIVDDRD